MSDYNLTWENHFSSLLSVFDSYLTNEKFVDVTLACEGKAIHVHRLVLLASSSYFEELLSLYPDKQAVVFLKDITFTNLQFLVQGRVCVPEDQLMSFLDTANSLKINGLSLFNNWKKQTGSSSNQNVDPAYIYPQQHTPAPSDDYVTDGYQQPEILTTNLKNYEEADGSDNCLKKRVPFQGSGAFYSSTIDESGGQQAVCFDHSTDSSSSTANETTHLENSLTFPVANTTAAENQENSENRSNASSRLCWSPRARLIGKTASSRANSKTRKRSSERSEVHLPVKVLNSFVCPNECGRSYKYDNGLKSHLRECGVTPQFHCPLCSSCFKRADHLRRHTQSTQQFYSQCCR